MNTNINISLNVPSYFEIDDLVSQLTEYGKKLIATKKSSIRKKPQSSSEFLKGLYITPEINEYSLVSEYLEEKYKQRG